MIRASATGGQTRLHGELAPGAVAYVDADWIAAGGGPVAALVVVDGGIGWDGGPTSALPPGVDGDAAAGAALLAVAHEAVAALGDVGPDRVAVTGAGLVAGWVRTAAGSGPAGPLPAAGSAAAIVETTGDPAMIQAATERLADLGILVLAGESGERVPLDVYADIHLRGLHVVGVAPALTEPLTAPAPGLPEPATVELGDVLPGAAWYRVVSRVGEASGPG